MPKVNENKKINTLTIVEFKQLIKDTFIELIDPDYGLELRPEIENELRDSKKQKKRGEGIPFEEVKKKLKIK